uniref:Uncharacterized protein n=1 Tax=Oryza brachyantha TaxID=4533 RepID=J3ME10_ORYBR
MHSLRGWMWWWKKWRAATACLHNLGRPFLMGRSVVSNGFVGVEDRSHVEIGRTEKIGYIQ